MRIRPLLSAIFAFLVVVVTLGVATAARAEGTVSAVNDAYSRVHDHTLVDAAPGVLGNDTDTLGNPQAALDQDVAHGSLTLGADGSVSYTPDAGYVGPDSFTYHIDDMDPDSGPVSSTAATVTISVTNADPVAVDDSYSVTQGQTLTRNAANGVLANDSDPDGDSITAHKLSGSSHGSLSLDADGSFTYTPNAPFFGTDQFTYQAEDGAGGTSDPATVTITVGAKGNNAPVAVDDSYSVTQGQTLTRNAANGVLANDSDPDGDSITAHKLSGSSHGSLSLDADGSFTYTPNAPFFGTDQFTYQAEDGAGGTSDPATVTITVGAKGNNAPVAVDDSYSVTQGQTLTRNAANGVLANDSDPDGDSITAHKLSGSSHGSLSLNADGSFTYTPNAPFFGTDQFTYQAEDGAGGTSDPATVTITVGAKGNNAPTAVADAYSTEQATALNVSKANGVLANDSDLDVDTLTANLLRNVTHGTLALNSGGSFTYTPNAGFFGVDRFTYQADDGHGGTSDPAIVTISVNSPGNSSPAALADTYSTQQATELDVSQSNGVLANDTDPNLDPLVADILMGVSHGTLNLSLDGSFTYTPNTGFFGKDHFTYQADDGSGGTSDPTTVTITVNPDRRPTAKPDTYSATLATRGHRLFIAAPGVLFNDTDPDGDSLRAQPAAEPARGTLTLNPNGSFTYLPNTGVCNASDRFTYRASDGILAGAPAPVTVRIRTPLKTTKMTFAVPDRSLRFGQSVTLRAHVRAFSPGAVVRFFVRRPGGAPTLLGFRRPDPKTHVAKILIRPARNAWYSALTNDNCFEGVKSVSRKIAVEAVGGGHMAGLRGRGDPTYVGYVHPTQPNGTVTFIWQRRSSGRWIAYLQQGENLDEHGHIALTLTSGVVPSVRYRVTLRWNGKGGNVPGHAPWRYFTG